MQNAESFKLDVFRAQLESFFKRIKATYIDDWKPELLEVVTPLEHSNVVKLDLIIGQAIIEFLVQNSPYPVFTEETITPQTTATTDRFWLVDPIDGTREFVQRIPESVSSIALIDRVSGATVFAAIYDLFGDIFYDTESFVPLRQKAKAPLTLLFSRSEASKGTGLRLANSSDLFQPIVPMGSIAYKLLKVAMTPEWYAVVSLAPKSLWDVAGSVGFGARCPWVKMTDLDGVPLDSRGPLNRRLNGIIGAHIDLYDDILTRIKMLRANA